MKSSLLLLELFHNVQVTIIIVYNTRVCVFFCMKSPIVTQLSPLWHIWQILLSSALYKKYDAIIY